MMSRRTFVNAVMSVVLTCLSHAHTAFAQDGTSNPCGDPFRNFYGPFDYRTAPKKEKDLVEGRHFTPGIETMSQPSTTTLREMAGDVAYTLAVFPNHPRALITMRRLAERYKSDPAPGNKVTVACWFDRAVRYAPDDAIVRLLFVQYLAKLGDVAGIEHHLAVASKLAGDNPLTNYNVGAVAYEIGRLDVALQHAQTAMKLGLARQDLKEKLVAAGKWKDAEQN